MANAFSVQIDDNLEEILKEKDGAVQRILEQWGLVAERYAKQYCPVDTGRLRNSISHSTDDKNTMYIGTNVEYAAYVEMGTSRQKAQPYIEPSLTNHMSEYRGIVENELKS